LINAIGWFKTKKPEEFSPGFFVLILQSTSSGLLGLNRFKQGLEISLAKRFGPFALNDFKKQGWAVFHGFGEYLKQITFFISVYHNAPFF